MPAAFHPVLGLNAARPGGRVRASTGAIFTKAQHRQGCIVPGHRRKARHISWPLVAVDGVEQPEIQHGVKTGALDAPAGMRRP
jgi:hypothetical protein